MFVVPYYMNVNKNIHMLSTKKNYQGVVYGNESNK